MPGYNTHKGHFAALRPPFRFMVFSLLAGIVTIMFFRNFYPSRTGESFCVLSFEGSASCRAAGELLLKAGFEDFYSESETKVYFDNFGQWKSYSLDEYREYIETFDPRDNGYAEKLRSFFNNGEKSRIFIPLGENAVHWQIERKINAAMGSIPFTQEFLGYPRKTSFWLFLQFAGVLFVFGISRDRWRFAMRIPLLMAFSLAGLPGIILSGILAGIGELLGGPMKEFYTGKPFGSFKERFRPYKPVFFRVLYLILLFFGLTILFEIAVLPVWIGYFCFLITDFFSYTRTTKPRRSLFTPVIILPFRPLSVSFPRSMAVIMLAAVLGSALLFVFPEYSAGRTGSAGMEFSYIPSEIEYLDYMNYQALFSYSPLGNQTVGYLSYYLGNDGLIAGSYRPDIFIDSDIPPFPLEKLIGFLLHYEHNPGETRLFLKEWLSVLLVFIVFIPRFKTAKSSVKKKYVIQIRERRLAA